MPNPARRQPDLPKIEHHYTLDQFLDREPARASAEALQQVRGEEDARRKADEAQLALDAARSATEAARETFANWLKTRNATQRVDQDPGLVAQTQALDQLKAAERTVEQRLEALNRTALELSERNTALSTSEEELRATAQTKLDAAERGQELRVFGYRPRTNLAAPRPNGLAAAEAATDMQLATRAGRLPRGSLQRAEGARA